MIRFHPFGSGLAALFNEIHSPAASLATPHTGDTLSVLSALVVLPHHPNTESKDGIHDNEHGNVLNRQTTEQHFSTFLVGVDNVIIARMNGNKLKILPLRKLYTIRVVVERSRSNLVE